MAPRLFLSFSALALLALIVIGLWPVPPYRASYRVLGCLDREVLYESKLEQARTDPRYDLMTFGNSRVIDVGAGELDLPGPRFFSMGIGGTSFRQSVVTLAALADAGKAPRVAVLSFDNVALLYAQLPYDFPLPPARWRLRGDDLAALIDAPYAVGPDWRKFFRNLAVTEMAALARTINLFRLEERLFAWAGMVPDGRSCHVWDADGSHRRPPVERELSGAAPKPWPVYEDRYPLLEHDLDRLARIQAAGTRVIIYESPLYPAVADALDPALPPEMAGQRRRLIEGCRARGLECHPAPRLAGSVEDGFWPDATHAPPRALGHFIAGLVRPHLATP
ncbi:hypothetical protein [Phaeospirillum tilakii]|uniref:SGNH/GDSL hydrolase family protein n=1 Tax=Phaeospirillum tilakii TaxID=741673 RepID=A0ABW5CD63_9PROT